MKRTTMQVIMSSLYSSKLLIKWSNSVLPEQKIWEMFYQLVGILQNISISESVKSNFVYFYETEDVKSEI